MAQEAITEFDMDTFSRRISPYFTWLESKIESGWQQSDHIQKDILKEVRYLATNMRARFILGIAAPDFSKEVQRTLELFELANEAFPNESEEVEIKIKLFCKGISEEFGHNYLPSDYRKTPDTAQEQKPTITISQEESKVTIKVEEPKVKKEEVQAQKVETAVKKEKPKVTVKQAPKIEKQGVALQVKIQKPKPVQVKAQKIDKKPIAKVSVAATKKKTLPKKPVKMQEKESVKVTKEPRSKFSLGKFLRKIIRIDL